MKKAYVFPGQGAQYPGMAKDLYENNLDVNIVFLEVRHGVAIHFYDDRGFDLVCEDKEFAKYLYDKYKDDIMECNIDFSTMNNF